MPTSLYTISFKDTANVLTYCSFEKQELADQAAWDNLRDKLVGDKLPLAVSTKNASIPAALLAADAIPGTPPSDFLQNPLGYQVSLTVPGQVIPGDGKDKILKAPGDNTITAVAIVHAQAGNPATVTATLAQNATAVVAASVFVDGQGPFAATVTLNLQSVKCQLPVSVSVAAGSKYEILFFMSGVPYWHSTETAT